MIEYDEIVVSFSNRIGNRDRVIQFSDVFRVFLEMNLQDRDDTSIIRLRHLSKLKIDNTSIILIYTIVIRRYFRFRAIIWWPNARTRPNRGKQSRSVV